MRQVLLAKAAKPWCRHSFITDFNRDICEAGFELSQVTWESSEPAHICLFYYCIYNNIIMNSLGHLWRRILTLACYLWKFKSGFANVPSIRSFCWKILEHSEASIKLHCSHWTVCTVWPFTYNQFLHLSIQVA